MIEDFTMQLNFILCGVFAFLSWLTILGVVFVFCKEREATKEKVDFTDGEKFGLRFAYCYLTFMGIAFAGLSWHFAVISRVIVATA